MNELADWLHQESCVNWDSRGGCRMYRPGTKHHDYYRDITGNVWTQLEPIIGTANIIPVVKIVMDELVLCPSGARTSFCGSSSSCSCSACTTCSLNRLFCVQLRDAGVPRAIIGLTGNVCVMNAGRNTAPVDIKLFIAVW
jgi:hypothetical protein